MSSFLDWFTRRDRTRHAASMVVVTARPVITDRLGDVVAGHDQATIENHNSAVIVRSVTVTLTNDNGQSMTKTFDVLPPVTRETVTLPSRSITPTASAEFTIHGTRWRTDSAGNLKRLGREP
jgi:hypothetical protein